MANLYIYFDKRTLRKDGTGTLKMGLTHRHKTCYESLDIHIRPDEWDADKGAVVKRSDKKFQNIFLRKRVSDAEMVLQRVALRDDFPKMEADEILHLCMRGSDTAETLESEDYVLPVYNEYIALAKTTSTEKIYRTSLNSLKEFEPHVDTLRFKDITVAWLLKYQHWMADNGMEVNGANVYLRNLRRIFNYALTNQYTAARYPFKDIDMSTTEPDKRMIPYETFLDWATFPVEDRRVMFRDLFMLSVYLCGIRPVDLLHVKKSQIHDGRLIYYPQKLAGRTRLSIKIEPEAEEIIDRYSGAGDNLVNVLDTRTDYKAFCRYWNRGLKAIGPETSKYGYQTPEYERPYVIYKHEGIVPFITAYYARTCWSTYLYNVLDVPMDIISQGLGHKSGLRVTNFYVKRDPRKVDEVNRLLIDRLNADMEEFRIRTGR